MDCYIESITSTEKYRLEYIRIRLYLMASLPNFEELVKNKVHLYWEYCFIGEIAKRIGTSRRSVNNYYKIAKAKLRAMENKNDVEFYEELADNYSSEFEIDVNILPQNYERFCELRNEYNL